MTAGDGGLPRVLKEEGCIELEGHEEDVVSLSWSKSLFLLTASTDCTVRLWFVPASNKCLRVFK